jgi:hypothetical protein
VHGHLLGGNYLCTGTCLAEPFKYSRCCRGVDARGVAAVFMLAVLMLAVLPRCCRNVAAVLPQCRCSLYARTRIVVRFMGTLSSIYSVEHAFHGHVKQHLQYETYVHRHVKQRLQYEMCVSQARQAASTVKNSLHVCIGGCVTRMCQ